MGKITKSWSTVTKELVHADKIAGRVTGFQAEMFQQAQWREQSITRPGPGHVAMALFQLRGLQLTVGICSSPTQMPKGKHLTHPPIAFRCTTRTARKIVRRLQLRMHFNIQQNCRNSEQIFPIPLLRLAFGLPLFFFLSPPPISRISSMYLTKYPELGWNHSRPRTSLVLKIRRVSEGKFELIKRSL